MISAISQGLDPKHSASQAFLWPIVRDFLPRLDKARILDIGCGPGNQARSLADLGYDVVGIDISAEAVAEAQRHVPEGCFHVADVYDLPCSVLEGKFDVVIALEVIEHLYHPGRLLQAADGCLRPGGTLILSTPYHGYAKNLSISILGRWDAHFNTREDGWHIKFFSPRTLRSLIENEGFVDIRFRYGGRLPFFWKSMACRARKLS
ncbi:MAG TPA: SAM-dependent methyltransferase [Deltaproteobacteria bacterium]|nr:SAM-dependent methyltransferase [Deltaproteobacteria bacterium]